MFSPVQRSPLHTLTGDSATLNPNRKLLIWETSGTIKSVLIFVSIAGYIIKAACLLSLIAVGIQNTPDNDDDNNNLFFKLDLLCTNTYVDTHTQGKPITVFLRIILYFLFTIYPIYSEVQKVQDVC